MQLMRVGTYRFLFLPDQVSSSSDSLATPRRWPWSRHYNWPDFEMDRRSAQILKVLIPIGLDLLDGTTFPLHLVCLLHCNCRSSP
jgi:hypothetical protein